MYPALAVLEQLNAEALALDVLWVGGEGGMEAELVAKAGVPFETIPAAGLHGVGLRALPRNLWRMVQGYFAARKLLRCFRPEVLFFTGGYVAAPLALAGRRIPTAIYVPDIEPGLALKVLIRFADRAAVTTADSRAYFPPDADVVVTGYPTRQKLSAWELGQARAAFDLQPDLPTLLVFGGSKGARSINRALFPALPDLLPDMQIIHISGTMNWPEVERIRETMDAKLATRYHAYPYLHDKMGAAFKAADLVLARAGASCLGEFPLFGLPAILVPYPYAWRYQKINAEYLARHGSAVIQEDAELPATIVSLVRHLMQDEARRADMQTASQALARPDAASSIARMLMEMASPASGNEVTKL